MFKFVLVALFVLSSAKGDPDGELQVIVGEFWDWFLEQFPEFATRIGDYRWNSERENFTLAAITSRKTDVESFLRRIEVLGGQRDKLSANEKINYDVLKFSLQTFVEGYEFFRSPQSLNPISYRDGPQLKTELKSFPFRRKADYLDYLSRISKTKQQIEEMIDVARLAITLGRTLHAVSIDRVPAQIDRILINNASELNIYKPFKETLDNMTSISQAEKEELRSEAIRIINQNYIDTFRQLKRFIEDEYLPNTRTAYGVYSWREDFYLACLKWHLSVAETPTAIHNLGLAEVERISTKMNKVIERSGLGAVSIAEYFTHLKENTTYQMSSPEEILETYTNMIHDRINPHLGQMFHNVPNLPVVVRTHPFGSRGSYSSGPSDGSRPGIFYTNTSPNQTFLFDMMALAAHEANPGHHLQVSYSLQVPSLPFRKHIRKGMYSVPTNFPTYTAYTEGWALYSESLLEEMGIYKGDAELMGRYSSEMYRACRLVIDTGIHAMGWSREEAILYMLRYTSLVRAEVESQVDRYITWPGQACAYKYGEIKIRNLRQKAETSLGKHFDIKDFHSVVLSLGRVPLSILERTVDEWINQILESKVPSLSCSSRLTYNLLSIATTVLLFTKL